MPDAGPHVLVADSGPAIRFHRHRNLKAEGYPTDATCGRTVPQAAVG
ncbi:hypothetical protein [Azospirillum sp.]